MSKRLHPKLEEQIRFTVAGYIDSAIPAPDDPAELAKSAAEIDVDPETLAEWRKDYQWWTTDEEWRRGVTDSLTGQIVRAIGEVGPRHWSRWRAWRWVVDQLMAIGIAAASSYSWDWAGSKTTVVAWTGQRSTYTGKRATPTMVLWWPTRKWRCLLSQHHWPTDDVVAFGMCSKCIPCPDCDKAAPLEHECEATP